MLKGIGIFGLGFFVCGAYVIREIVEGHLDVTRTDNYVEIDWRGMKLSGPPVK